MNLHGSLALITGAAGGLGTALARELAHHGADLVLTDLDAEPLAPLATELRATGRRVRCEALDVTDQAAWHALANTLARDGLHPTILVNNAGVAAAGAALDLSDHAWKQVIDVDLWGVVHGCRTFVPRMLDQAGACAVLNVSSASGHMAMPMAAPYFIAKAGVLRLTQCLRSEIDSARVSFTALCPGFVATGIGARALSLGTAEGPAAHTLNRMANPPHRSTAHVARKAVRGMVRGQAVVNVFWEGWVLDLLGRVLPHDWVAPIGRRYLSAQVGRSRQQKVGYGE